MTDKNEKKEELLTFKNLRDISVLLFFGVMSFKLFSMDLSLDIKEFGFTDLLSMIVAFFAIGLSVVFYFKATDTSNRFYDNSYAFTKDVSEILGRMEAGFGERLKHLDEGYSGIRDKFDRLPFDSTKAMEEIEKENLEIKEKEAEQHKMLEDLAKRAKLAENEKVELFEHMHQLSNELEESKSEARRLEREIRVNSHRNEDSSFKVLDFIVRKIVEARDPGISMKSVRSSYRHIFREIKTSLPKMAIRDLERFGFMDEDGELTREAIEKMRMIESNVA